MSLGGPGGDTDDVVAALRAVAGVFDAEILPDDTGGPGTLRLQLEPGADEVRVATTVHRLLGDRFGLGVDAGRVQVVEEAMPRRPMRFAEQLRAAAEPSREPAPEAEHDVEPRAEPEPTAKPEPTAVPGPRAVPGTGRHAARPALAAVPEPTGPEPELPELDRAEREPEPELDHEQDESEPTVVLPEPELEPKRIRLLIHRMQLVSARSGVSSEVSLEREGAVHSGYAEALSTTASVHRAVAQATLRAVEEAVGPTVRFELEHLETMPLGAEYAVVVEISMVTRIGTERLTGVSAVREDTRQAVIRATLDALNRRIETYLVSS